MSFKQHRLNSETTRKDAVKIHSFLETLPKNVSLLVTSRIRNNLAGEELINIEGLPDAEGAELFRSVARRHFKKITKEMEQKLSGLSNTLYGHPLAIKLLAGAYRGGGPGEIDSMSSSILMQVESEKEAEKRQKSINACFDYSFNRLNKKPRQLVLGPIDI